MQPFTASVPAPAPRPRPRQVFGCSDSLWTTLSLMLPAIAKAKWTKLTGGYR